MNLLNINKLGATRLAAKWLILLGFYGECVIPIKIRKTASINPTIRPITLHIIVVLSEVIPSITPLKSSLLDDIEFLVLPPLLALARTQ